MQGFFLVTLAGLGLVDAVCALKHFSTLSKLAAGREVSDFTGDASQSFQSLRTAADKVARVMEQLIV